MRFFALLVVLALGAGGPAAAEGEPVTLAGTAVVLDGDTLIVEGKRVRLWGIDTPEMRDWPGGICARSTLDRLAHRRAVRCVKVGGDRHGRTVALCQTVDGEDLGMALLLAGAAVTYRKFLYPGGADPDPPWPSSLWADAYDSAEIAARGHGRGVWGAWAAGCGG